MAGGIFFVICVPVLVLVILAVRDDRRATWDAADLLVDALEASHPHVEIVAGPHTGGPLGRPVNPQ